LFSGFVLLHNFDMVLVRVPFDMSQVATIIDSNIHKNHSVIMKIDKISLVRFLWFTEIRLVTIRKIQNLRNFGKMKTER
jgi:hypothetical protein